MTAPLQQERRPFVFSNDGALEIPPGGVALRAPGGEGRVALASRVLEQGWGALGAPADAPPSCYVLSEAPPLDDLLAAEIAWRRSRGQAPPPGLARFAEYAALLREGLSPESESPANTLEAVYAAIAHSPSSQTEQLLEGWARLASFVWQAAEQGKDPLTESLTLTADFPREASFLKRDLTVYRRDVASGQRWAVELPDSKARLSALVLERPKSVLFKMWARRDPTAPGGNGYSVLVVAWPNHSWIISTNPAERLSLLFLAQALQRREERAVGTSAAGDPWFDGARFAHSLIAAPKAGTKLEPKAVLKVLREELHARPIASAGKARAWKAAVLGVPLALAVAGLVWIKSERQPPQPVVTTALTPTLVQPHPNQGEPDLDRVAMRGALAPDEVAAVQSKLSETPAFGLFACFDYPTVTGKTLRACPGAVELYGLLVRHYGLPPENVWFVTDEPAVLQRELVGQRLANGHIVAATGRDGFFRALDQLGVATRAHKERNPNEPVRRFVFYYGGHGERKQQLGPKGYLAFPDWFTGTTSNAEAAGMDMDDLVDKIKERLAVTHTLMLLDACFSGLVTRSDEAPETAVLRHWGQGAESVITASGGEQVAFEVAGRSVFVAALIDALTPGSAGPLADSHRDGIVTEGELGEYVRRNIHAHCPPRGAGSADCQNLNPAYRPWKRDQGQFLFVPRR